MDFVQKICFLILSICFLSPGLSGQENKIYSNMSLDELLNIDVIVTASKKPEDLFEAPLSVTIIKKEEISRSGATSIPEALRLSSEVIVREITPGNYDIHIRGYDDITKNVYLTLPYNTTTLVMIDNRIVYSYFSGGTTWEAFPIDINNVERIEVVKGPASALYGSNAVTGVINIITSHSSKKGLNVFANGTGGTNNSKNASTNIGYNWNDKTKLTFSGNFSERRRFTNDYYDFKNNQYTSLDKLDLFLSPLKNQATRQPWTFKDFQEELGVSYNGDISLKRLGGNIFFSHAFSEQSTIDVATGMQNSQSQKTGFLNLATALSQIESKSAYFDARIKLKNLFGQFNVNSGHDYSNYEVNSYRFTNIDANLEYFKQFGEISLRPGVGYKHISYNNPFTYSEPANLNTFDSRFKDDPRISYSYSASLLSEWKPMPKLRFIGAVRVDKFGMNKNYFGSYEFASTYRLNKNNLFRMVLSSASKSPFIIDTYANTNIFIDVEYVDKERQRSYPFPAFFQINGQKDLKYPTITNWELCWRTKPNTRLSLDFEFFYSRVKNFVNPNIYREFTVVQHMDEAGNPDSLVSIAAKGLALFENYDLKASQFGFGFTVDYKISDKLDAKFYTTYQRTSISGRTDIDLVTTDIDFGELTPENTFSTTVFSKMNPTQWSEKLTPSFYGGFQLNYRYNSQWNFNSDAYFYSSQLFETFDYLSLDKELSDKIEGQSKMEIKSNLLINAKAIYKLNKNIQFFATIRNILGTHSEYGFTDKIGRSLLVGFQWEL